MAQVHCFTFNAFQENTYIIYDDTGDCLLIDPGCFDERERRRLRAFVSERGLRPVRLLNTHCHIDHVFGNAFVAKEYGLGLEIHAGELPVLYAFPEVARMYGIAPIQPSPEPVAFLKENTVLEFGNTRLELLFAPGHSPASLCFYDRAGGYVVAGDVLFEGSIGRTDLPGGNYKTLMNSIVNQLLPLPDDTVVYAGHGDPTTIGRERIANPFIAEWLNGR